MGQYRERSVCGPLNGSPWSAPETKRPRLRAVSMLRRPAMRRLAMRRVVSERPVSRRSVSRRSAMRRPMIRGPVIRQSVIRRAVIRRALKFALVGTAGLVVNTVALFALHGWARLPVPLASALAVELAIGHNFLLNDWWTFAVRRPSLRRFAKFNVSALGGLACNVIAVWGLVSLGTHLVLANVIGVAVGFLINFVVSAGWVWAQRPVRRTR